MQYLLWAIYIVSLYPSYIIMRSWKRKMCKEYRLPYDWWDVIEVLMCTLFTPIVFTVYLFGRIGKLMSNDGPPNWLK